MIFSPSSPFQLRRNLRIAGRAMIEAEAPLVTRYFVIVLALGAAVYRYTTGAVLEAVGLVGLAAGLLLLRMSGRQPRLKPLAYLSFLVTAAVIAFVLFRNVQ